MKAFLASLLALVVISGAAALVLERIDRTTKQVYQVPANVRL